MESGGTFLLYTRGCVARVPTESFFPDETHLQTLIWSRDPKIPDKFFVAVEDVFQFSMRGICCVLRRRVCVHHADGVHVYRPTCRRLPVFLDQPPTTGFNSFPYSSTLRGCPTKLDRVSPRGLLCSTAYQLTLMAALKSRFTNSMRFLLPPSLVLTSVNHPRSRGVSATPVSSSPSRRANTFTGLSPYFVFATCSFPLDGRRKGEFFRFLSGSRR